MRTSYITITAIFLFITSSLLAGSFQAPSIGARATGMAGAYVAVTDDPLALYWNPAGLSMIEGKILSIGNTSVKGYARYETVKNALFSIPEGEEEKNKLPWQLIPHAAFGMNLSEKCSFGVGNFTPYGLNQVWKEDAEYKYNSIRSEIWLNTIQIGASYKLNENFSIGGSLGEGFAKMNAKQMVMLFTPSPTQSFAKVNAESHGMEGSLGFLWQATENVSVGGAWHSASRQYLKGKVDFSPQTGDSFQTDMRMKFTFPQYASLGLAYKGFENWLLSFQVDWTDWSEMGTLVEHLDKPVPLGSPVAVDTVKIKRDWKDTYAYRVGAEYKLNERLSLRCGYMWDPSPVPEETLDPLMFDVSLNRYSVGLGYKVDNWSIDIAYMYSKGIEREVGDSENMFPTNGDYRGSSHVVDITFSYMF